MYTNKQNTSTTEKIIFIITYHFRLLFPFARRSIAHNNTSSHISVRISTLVSLDIKKVERIVSWLPFVLYLSIHGWQYRWKNGNWYWSDFWTIIGNRMINIEYQTFIAFPIKLFFTRHRVCMFMGKFDDVTKCVKAYMYTIDWLMQSR